ncbi:hypothetical protein P4310_11480 [Bacillus thuringiensis]|uniref:hypothetical protein n=1 Tax=Bacillus cereus group TaxID=86661 RepID=UPI000A3D5FE4|nr:MULTISPECIES: hypothetical protein [Bacillus cereus group]MED3066166.1 hypothetical protein [Bacillus thuringiensis]OUB30362.1 hypothetical protein BK737_18565 [Bacillus thuringiensis serovar palmanyolensis]
MKDLSIQEIVELVIAETPDAEDRIQKMYEWHFESVKSLSQWCLGASVSIIVGFFVALFKSTTSNGPSWWQVLLVIILVSSTACYGLYLKWKLKSINKQYVSALKLFAEVKEIKTFISRYWEQ